MLAPLGRHSSSCMRRLRQATLSQIEERFAPALPTSLFPKTPSGPHSRERIFTLQRTLWGWFWQVLSGATSCRHVVRQVQALFAMHEAGHVDEGSSAYCQARRKVPISLLEDLLKACCRNAERAAPSPTKSLLQNRPIRVVDGSGSRLADTPMNRAAYPPSDNMLAATGFPFLRLVVIFSLVSGAILAQASGSLHCGELRLWYALLSNLRPNDVLLGDRAYGIYVVAALLHGRGVDLIATALLGREKSISAVPKSALALMMAFSFGRSQPSPPPSLMLMSGNDYPKRSKYASYASLSYALVFALSTLLWLPRFWMRHSTPKPKSLPSMPGVGAWKCVWMTLKPLSAWRT